MQVLTANGWPAVSTPVLRKLAGKPGAAKRALEQLVAEEGPGGVVNGSDGVVNTSIPTAGGFVFVCLFVSNHSTAKLDAGLH